MKIKEYGYPVVRLHDIYQIMLYVSHRVLPIDEYVSLRPDGTPLLIQVFKHEDTVALYKKYRNRKLQLNEIYIDPLT